MAFVHTALRERCLFFVSSPIQSSHQQRWQRRLRRLLTASRNGSGAGAVTARLGPLLAHLPVSFPRGGVLGRPPASPPKPCTCFFSAGFRIWKEHIRFSSTVIMAPALSNSPLEGAT